MILEKQRKRVIEIALEVEKLNLVPLTFGNFSLRDLETGYICITPSGMKYSNLLPADIVVMDINCNIIDGNRLPSIESFMHCLIYKKRLDVFGVVHTHSTYATAWACCNKNIPCILAESACIVGGPILCAPFAPGGSKELAELTVNTLSDSGSVLMEKHGLLSVGSNIENALANAIIVEESAKIAFIAKGIGEITELPSDLCSKLRNDTLKNYGQR